MDDKRQPPEPESETTVDLQGAETPGAGTPPASSGHLGTQAAPPVTGSVQHIGTLELHEELPVIVREQVQTGQVSFRREVQVRTETISMELRRETLQIQVGPGSAAVYLGEDLLAPGETREVLLYDEQIVVSKEPYVTEEVRIGKRVVTELQETTLDLGYEVLVTERSDTAKADISTSGTSPEPDAQLPARQP